MGFEMDNPKCHLYWQEIHLEENGKEMEMSKMEKKLKMNTFLFAKGGN